MQDRGLIWLQIIFFVLWEGLLLHRAPVTVHDWGLQSGAFDPHTKKNIIKGPGI